MSLLKEWLFIGTNFECSRRGTWGSRMTLSKSNQNRVLNGGPRDKGKVVFLQYIKVLLKHDEHCLEIRTVTLPPYEGQYCKNIYSFLLCSRPKKN